VCHPRSFDPFNMHQNIQHPFVLVTNGGGVPDKEKARSLCSILEMHGYEDALQSRLVAAHDPLPQLLKREKLFEQRVLVLSKTEQYSRAIAAEWGLPQPVILEDLYQSCPCIWPTRDTTAVAVNVESVARIAAVCVIATPDSWGDSLQLICDLIVNGGRLFANAPDASPIALFVSNPDFDYRARPPLNRMTTGAWLHCLLSLVRHYNGNIEPQIGGKPHLPIYNLAREVLEKQRSPITSIVAIGDNPSSDIRGAKNAGAVSVLVLSGMATENDPNCPADHVCPSIVEAIDWLLAKDNSIQ
jgi:HAD superfamily hydrolase (TIGR01456 family)